MEVGEEKGDPDTRQVPPPSCGRRRCASFVTGARGAGRRVSCMVPWNTAFQAGRLVVLAVVCDGIVDAQTDAARRTQTHRVAEKWKQDRSTGRLELYSGDGRKRAEVSLPEQKVGPLEYFDCVNVVVCLFLFLTR